MRDDADCFVLRRRVPFPDAAGMSVLLKTTLSASATSADTMEFADTVDVADVVDVAVS